MELQSLQIMAGCISSLLFISGNLPMLVKAFHTKDLRSYSLSNIVLINAGDLVYWLYVSNLPFGPIWVLHSFYTVAEILMLVWYLRYEFSRSGHRAEVAAGQHSSTNRNAKRRHARCLLTLPLLERVHSIRRTIRLRE